MDDVNDLGYQELRTLDAMNSLRVCMIGITPGHELRSLNATNNLELWLT